MRRSPAGVLLAEGAIFDAETFQRSLCRLIPGGGCLAVPEDGLVVVLGDAESTLPHHADVVHGRVVARIGCSSIPTHGLGVVHGDAETLLVQPADGIGGGDIPFARRPSEPDRKSTRLNSSHLVISYTV